jgi:hypothetical protein
MPRGIRVASDAMAYEIIATSHVDKRLQAPVRIAASNIQKIAFSDASISGSLARARPAACATP